VRPEEVKSKILGNVAEVDATTIKGSQQKKITSLLIL